MYDDTQDMIEKAMKTSIQIWALGLDKLARYARNSNGMTMHPKHSCNKSDDGFWKDGFRIYRYVFPTQNASVKVAAF